MYKIIGLVRVSSDRQDTEQQHNAIERYLTGLGFKPDEIKWHEVKSSAYKVADEYKEFIEDIKNDCTENNINAICCYHLNRVGRDEDWLFNFKKFCVENKIQLYCMEPAFRLLNDDLTLNDTSDMIYNLFISFIKSETKERMNKLIRGKRHHKSLGKYIGGVIRFGYMTDDEKNILINPEEAKIVRQIYELYATRKYSGWTLATHLNLLGIKRRGGKWFSGSLMKMLKDTAYTGAEVRDGYKYPRIIEDELYQKVEYVRTSNEIPRTRETQHCHMATGLIQCPICGRKYTCTGTHYECVGSSSWRSLNVQKCESVMLKKDVIDGLLWYIAKEAQLEYEFSIRRKENIDTRAEIKECEKVISGLKEEINELKSKKLKLQEAYYAGQMNEITFNKLMSKNSSSTEKLENEIGYMENRIEMLQARQRSFGDLSKSYKELDCFKEEDKPLCRDIIRSMIMKVVPSREDKETYLELTLFNGKKIYIRFRIICSTRMKKKHCIGYISHDREDWKDFIYQERVEDKFVFSFSKYTIKSTGEKSRHVEIFKMN